MANTFKVCTIADVAVDSGTYSTLYTVAGSTTTVILGLNICNKINAVRDVTVKLTSDTSGRTGAIEMAGGLVIPGQTYLKRNVAAAAGVIRTPAPPNNQGQLFAL